MSEDNAPDVAGIAERLSEAQRQAILDMSEVLQRPASIPAGGSTLRSLMDFGRDPQSIAPPIMLVRRDYADWPQLAWEYGLTPLGLALRNHLMEKNDVQG